MVAGPMIDPETSQVTVHLMNYQQRQMVYFNYLEEYNERVAFQNYPHILSLDASEVSVISRPTLPVEVFESQV